jgi:hypothetical protein
MWASRRCVRNAPATTSGTKLVCIIISFLKTYTCYIPRSNTDVCTLMFTLYEDQSYELLIAYTVYCNKLVDQKEYFIDYKRAV